MPAAALSFVDLYRRFGRLAVLRGVSARITNGELLLVTGINGSGKSTLLKCLAGLLAPDRGQIEYREGEQLLETRERRLRVGYVAPDLALYEELSVAENLRFFARLRRVPAEPGLELAARFGLPPERPAGALSSGMLQRLRWSWALLHRPRLLLLDEPFQNLDEPGRQTASQLIREHLATGLAVVANPTHLDLPDVSHRLNLAG